MLSLIMILDGFSGDPGGGGGGGASPTYFAPPQKVFPPHLEKFAHHPIEI